MKWWLIRNVTLARQQECNEVYDGQAESDALM